MQLSSCRRVERVDECPGFRGKPVVDLRGHGVQGGPLYETRGFEFLQTQGRQPVEDPGNGGAVVAEAGRACVGGREDRFGPATVEELEAAAESRAGPS